MQQETIILVVNLSAAALILVAFLLYNLNNDQISAGTWFILASGEFLDFGSYWDMVGGDFLKLASNLSLTTTDHLVSSYQWGALEEEWIKSIVPAAFAIGTIATFVMAFIRRRFAWPDATDWFIVFLDAGITAYWLSTGEPVTSNLLYQGTTVMAFIPMYRGLLKRKISETFWPWTLWTVGYLGFLGTALATFENQPAELAYPLVGVVTHVLVVAYVVQKKGVRR